MIADPPDTGNGVTLVSGMAIPLTAMWNPEIDAGREKGLWEGQRDRRRARHQSGTGTGLERDDQARGGLTGD